MPKCLHCQLRETFRRYIDALEEDRPVDGGKVIDHIALFAWEVLEVMPEPLRKKATVRFLENIAEDYNDAKDDDDEEANQPSCSTH